MNVGTQGKVVEQMNEMQLHKVDQANAELTDIESSSQFSFGVKALDHVPTNLEE